MIRLLLASFFLAAASSTASAQQVLWKDYAFGMSEAEASRVSPWPLSQPEPSAKGCKQQTASTPQVIGGLEFNVRLVFCKRGLDRVVLEAAGLKDRTDVEIATEVLDRALREKYGQPEDQSDLEHDDTEFYSTSRRWLSEGTDVYLLTLTVAGDWKRSMVAVVYTCETRCLAAGL